MDIYTDLMRELPRGLWIGVLLAAVVFAACGNDSGDQGAGVASFEGSGKGATNKELAQLPRQFPGLDNISEADMDASVTTQGDEKTVNIAFPLQGTAAENALRFQQRFLALGWRVTSAVKSEGNRSSFDLSGFGWEGTAIFESDASRARARVQLIGRPPKGRSA